MFSGHYTWHIEMTMDLLSFLDNKRINSWLYWGSKPWNIYGKGIPHREITNAKMVLSRKGEEASVNKKKGFRCCCWAENWIYHVSPLAKISILSLYFRFWGFKVCSFQSRDTLPPFFFLMLLLKFHAHFTSAVFFIQFLLERNWISSI